MHCPQCNRNFKSQKALLSDMNQPQSTCLNHFDDMVNLADDGWIGLCMYFIYLLFLCFNWHFVVFVLNRNSILVPYSTSVTRSPTSSIRTILSIALTAIAATPAMDLARLSSSHRSAPFLIYLAFLTSSPEPITVAREWVVRSATEGEDDEVPDDEEEGEDLCNCQFSLAYDAKTLLNTATLHLKRGHRYGLCGKNGTRKSTLILANKEEVIDTLASVGFSDERQG